MRTKTLLLSGIVAALSGASLMAQVYSVNTVGYINVSLPANGFTIISDQLFANGPSTPQYLSPMLDSQVLDGTHNGLEFFKYGAAGYNIVYVNSSAQWNQVGGLNAAASVTLNPGEAVFVFNPNAATTLTFVGTVPQTSATLNLTNGLPSGFSLASSIVPQTGAIDTTLGLTPTVGDEVFLYDPVHSYSVYIFGAAGWQTAVQPVPPVAAFGYAPQPAVGQGFFYFANVGVGQKEIWNRTFNVN